MNNKLIIFSESDIYIDRARILSERLQIPFTLDKNELKAFLSSENKSTYKADSSSVSKPLFINLGADGLSLTDGNLILRGDFTENLKRLKQSNLERELLVKAARLKNADHPPILIDATAGMGEDSLLLAASGFKVILYEYDLVIASLLEDTLLRASGIPELTATVSRMELRMESSIDAMQKLDFSPDVILLDPMFPARSKSALVKKKFQLLQQLEHPCSDETDLIKAALCGKPHKIIIKRPLKGPFLADIKPDYSLSGKAIRYDCLLPETRKLTI